MTATSLVFDAARRAAFEATGIAHVRRAFDAHAAGAMCDVVWRELARQYGIDRDDRATWTIEAPAHLQHLKGRPEFRAIGSARTRAAIGELLDRPWAMPAKWGAFFVLFPVPGARHDVPADGWHVDAPYGMPVRPVAGLKVFPLLADLPPGGGGTMLVAGSHRVGERWARSQDASTLAKNARARRALLHSHPFFEALRTPGDPAARVDRFMHHDTDVDGIAVRIVEVTGSAGDIVLVHPGVLHARPTNCGTEPRFMLAKDIWSRG